MALRRIVHCLRVLLGPLPVTRSEAQAIAMAEFERMGLGDEGQVNVSRWKQTWTVVWRPRNMMAGTAVVKVDGRTGEVLLVRAGGR